MPSSSNFTATNQTTAIVSEFSKLNNIKIGDNCPASSKAKKPAHKFYGVSDGDGGVDKSIPLQQLLMSKPKIEQTDGEKVICKQNVDQPQQCYSNLRSIDDDDDDDDDDESKATKMKRLCDLDINDEVLIEFDGGKFYLGIIKDRKNDTVLTQFENGMEQWTPVNKLKKLNFNDDTDAMCIVCKEYDGIVQVCSQCRRGYHKKCIKTPTNSDDDCSSSTWHCNVCSTSSALANCERQSVQQHQTQATNDTVELANSCYCGEKGDWFMQMLQCARCLQWFHAKCIKCLNFPLYFGDRFYLFACARCNHGVEFLRRLHMNIEEVVHLLLFNLTLQFRKRYYNLQNVIYPYARENWHALQLPPKLKNMISSDIKDEIMKALRSHSDRFRPGSEVKKKVLNWALVSRTPPKAPNIVLPRGPLLTEKYINDLFKEEARINFMAQNIHNPSETVFNDAKIKDLMSGKNVAAHIISSEENSSDDMDSGAFSSTSDDDLLANFTITKQFGIHIKGMSQDETSQTSSDKSTTITTTTTAAAKRRKSSLPQLGQSEKSNDNSLDFNYSSDDTFTLDAIIPPPKNFSGINNPFLIDSNACHDSRSFTTPSSSSSSSSASLLLLSSSTNKTTLLKCTNSENIVPQPPPPPPPPPPSALHKGQVVQMVRTVKRRLSANDIIIGPNMEVKRRKLKKRLENVEVISTSSLADLPKSATYLPLSADSKRISIAALRSTLNGLPTKTKAIDGKKRERMSLDSNLFSVPSSSTSESQSITTTPSLISSISSSPIKDSLKEESMADLQSSLNIYFGGVVNRIENGESFAIKGKRILSDGRLQYLIDWDGVS